MEPQARWITFRLASQRLAAETRKGSASDAKIRNAVSKLWRGYWRATFRPEWLRLCSNPSDRSPNRYDPPESAAAKLNSKFDQRSATPDFLVQLVAGSGYLPSEVLNERGGAERFTALAKLDPHVVCPTFLERLFLEIEIEPSAFEGWKSRRAPSTHDNGRALARNWFKKNPDAGAGTRAEAVRRIQDELHGEVSTRAVLEVLRERGDRKPGRPARN